MTYNISDKEKVNERKESMKKENTNEMRQMGEIFKEVRSACGFTQDQMATFLGVDRTLITKYEKGERGLGIGALERACEVFGCNLNVLRGIEEYKPMTVAYRAKDLTIEDMEAICMVQKIALNLRRIKEYGKE